MKKNLKQLKFMNGFIKNVFLVLKKCKILAKLPVSLPSLTAYNNELSNDVLTFSLKTSNPKFSSNEDSISSLLSFSASFFALAEAIAVANSSAVI